MRLITYNVHRWRTVEDQSNVALVAALLKRVDADVIGLNEVYHPVPAEKSLALPWLADQLGMTFIFAACEPRKPPEVLRPGACGNALLSRLPVLSIASGLFPPIAGREQRGFLEARIEAGGAAPVSVVLTHLDHAEERARQAQFAELMGWFEQTGRLPDFLLGDFNCVHPREYANRRESLAALSTLPRAAHLANAPEGPQLACEVEQAGYVDALVVKGQAGTSTFVPAREAVRLDYIWLRSAWASRLVSARVVEEPVGREASDHRAVLAELVLTGS